MRKIRRNPDPSTAIFEWHDMLWSQCIARKEHCCWWSGNRIAKGDIAYRPVTNGEHRMRRLLLVPTGAHKLC